MRRILLVILLTLSYSVSFSNQTEKTGQADLHTPVTEKPILNIGIMDNESPATYYLDGENYGIAFELFSSIAEQLDLNINYINYNKHGDAIRDLENNKLSVLIGAFTHDPIYESQGIIHSPLFFIDEDIVVSPKKHLTFENVYEMIWTDLLKNTIIFSFIMGIVFWILLLIFEGSKHEELKHMSFFNKLTYAFFQIWACFLRDLIYDPATNSGRVLMSVWMFFSIIMITVVTSIMTSTIIILNSENYSVIKSVKELHFHEVGYLSGHHSAEFAIKLVGGHTIPFEYTDDLLKQLSKKQIDFGVLSKTLLEDYLINHSEIKKDIVVSNVATGYEGWVFLYNKNGSIYQDINKKLVSLVEKGGLYSICAKYISHPEHCLVM